MIRAICGVARSFKIYYPIRGYEVGPITSNILFPECDLKRTRGGNVLFKRRELRGGRRDAGNKSSVTAEKRRFSVSFHAQVNSIPQSASARKFFQRCTSMRTMRMQKTGREIQIYGAC